MLFGPLRRKSTPESREAKSFYLFIMPWLLGFLLLTAFPMVFGFYISLTNYNGFNFENLKFVGFANYQRAFLDKNFLSAISRTLYFAAISVPLNLLAATVVAFVLTRRVRFAGLFRTIFYIPAIVSIVAVAWMWQLLFDKNFGLVNNVISLFSPGTAVPWLVQHPTEMLIFLALWTGLGGGMLILMAGLRNIPRDLEDAAMVDGANTYQMFRHITLPLLTPVLLYQTIVYLIVSLRVLVEPILLSASESGAAGQGTLSAPVPKDNLFLLVHAYREIFVQGRFGYGSALIWYLFIIILILTVILMYTSNRWVTYDR